MAIIGDALRQAFMARHEYETLRDEDKAWGKIRRPLVVVAAAAVSSAVVAAVLVSVGIVFPSEDGVRPFCTGGRRGQNARMDAEAYRYHGAYYLTDEEAADYYWMVVFVPSLIVFAVSAVYLLAGEKI